MENSLENEAVKEVREALENNDHAAAAVRIQTYLDEQSKILLNIAVTGETGSGKSTFINAFRGINDDDEGAAPTGCVETTLKVTAYPHPVYPNVKLWDLPGIGSINFPADKYVKHVGFEKFDFFIIISDDRLGENDVKLAKEIQRMKKKFYFVRSKIDHKMQDEKRSQNDFNAEKTLAGMRADCIKGLQTQGVKSPKVFLVSSFQLHLFDFQLLKETLNRELPAHKRVDMGNPLDNETFKEVREALENNDHTAAAVRIQTYLDTQSKIQLNFAVTGETGSGKSTFINAFRGINNKDKERAAPTGCVETTLEATPYPHPVYPNVILWDLPGIGTMNFPADEYVKHVGFEKFDFFIIISNDRFRENDAKLAKEIQRMKKKFYFVRSKIDHNMRDEERSQNDFNAEKTLAGIRADCIQGLQTQGVESPKVFLVSSFDLHLFDFQHLQQTLECELPAHKRDVLLLLIPNISLEIINKKKEAFKAQIKYYAARSVLGAAVPVPGAAMLLDSAILVDAVIKYQRGFGVDVFSLHKLADSTHVPFDDLIAVTKSPLCAAEITTELILTVLMTSTVQIGLMAAEEGARFIPLLGLPLAMGLSFISTYKAMNSFLNMLADDAQSVLIKALGLNTSV